MFTTRALKTPLPTSDGASPFTRVASDEALERVAGLSLESNFTKHLPPRQVPDRRESLLTRQLHASESESHDEDHPLHSGTRAQSYSSVAELTSDNDLTSPGTRGNSPSPPLPATRISLLVPPIDKQPVQEPVIVGHDISSNSMDKSEQKVESGLGRRRCITFACGGAKKPEIKPPVVKEPEAAAASPPKRKCALTFICPTRTKPVAQRLSPIATRHMTPTPGRMPKSPRSPRVTSAKVHRNSDATVTQLSPVALRKVPSFSKRRQDSAKYADAPDEDAREAKRFHEFAVNSKNDDEWTEVSTVHRKRLTVNDTLAKENVFRKLGQEVDEDEADEDDEAILDELDAEEHVDEEEDDEEDATDGDLDGSEDDSEADSDDDLAVSDGGFSTDDEHGFANSSESDGEGSDYEWWAPGRSTAATSAEHLDLIRPTFHRKMSDSSLESAREANGLVLRRHKRANRKGKGKSGAVTIERAPTPELPDSTDFVCGTLDEDRPLEQAYLHCMQERHAAKRKFTPQDIDPTFPTSDFENDDDEEDEVSERGSDNEDDHLFMTGNMDIAEDRRRGREAANARKVSKTPSPRRFKSPPPAHRVPHRSPAPPKKRDVMKSPPLPTVRGRCRSPPPKKLFGRSPPRMRSPAPVSRPSSPPNSRSSSKEGTPRPGLRFSPTSGLGARPTIKMAASLPRVPTLTSIHNASSMAEDDEEEGYQTPDRRHRGAIDIVKGLEKKRARRREKLYQKQCQKVKKDVEKRCKPGKGAERMRELGLELAAYRGKKAEHILSV